MDIAELSDKQISRLRNKHPVRMKKGTGHKLSLNEKNMKKCSKCFSKNNGATIALDDDEVEMNGAGIFKKFKRAVKRTARKTADVGKDLGSKIDKASRKTADVGKDVGSKIDKASKTKIAKKSKDMAIDFAIDGATASVIASNPMVATTAIVAGEEAKKKAKGKAIFTKMKKIAKQAEDFAKKPVVARKIKNTLKEGVDKLVDVGAAGIVATNPELAPAVLLGKDQLKSAAKSKLDKAFSSAGKKSLPSVDTSAFRDPVSEEVSRDKKHSVEYSVGELQRAIQEKLKDLDLIEGTGLFYSTGRGVNGIGLPDSVQSMRHYQTNIDVAPLQKCSI